MDEDQKKSKLFVIIMAVVVVGLIVIGFILTWFIVRDGMSDNAQAITFAIVQSEPFIHHH